MAHEIETHGDKAAFFTLREDAWHKLGTTVTEAKSVEEALAIAHLSGWNVRKQPIFTVVNGEYVEVKGRYAMVRDNPFEDGKVDVYDGFAPGRLLTPIQNEEHAAMLDALLTESGASIETAGSIRDGKEVFVTMKLPETVQIGGKDAIDTYIAALNAHDGSKQFRFLVTEVRVVCRNTQAAAERGAKSSFSVRHTANSTKGIAEKARQALDLTFKYQGEFQAEADKMIEQALTNKQFDDIIRRLFPVEKDAKPITLERQTDRQVALRNLFRASDTMEDIRGTRWAGYQAITEYLDHFRPVRGDTVEDANARRLKSALTDPSIVKAKQKAWDAFQVKPRSLQAV